MSKKRKKPVDFIRRIEKKYPIEAVFGFVHEHIVVENYPKYQNSKENRLRFEFDGDMIKPWSLRYLTFILKGTTCCHCKLEATHFYKERAHKNDLYHLNLYGINKKGEEILFTKDHQNPKSKGGSNKVKNFLTMCHPCNNLKGNMTLEEWNIKKGSM